MNNKLPILSDWNFSKARQKLSGESKVVVLDWDYTLAVATPTSLLDSNGDDLDNAFSDKDRYLGKVDWGLNGEPIEHSLFLRPHAHELIEACVLLNYKLVLWSQGVATYIRSCLTYFNVADCFDLIIPRHPTGILFPKDLWLIQPDLRKVVIVDDSDRNCILNPFNAIKITPWNRADTSDDELIYMPYLIRYRLSALEIVSPEYLVEFRESIRRNGSYSTFR